MRKRILPIAMGRHLDNDDNSRSKFLMKHFGIPKLEGGATNKNVCKVIPYPDFGFMVGNIEESLYPSDRLPESADGDQVLILYESENKVNIPNKHGNGSPKTESYNFGKICNTATSTAIRSIFYPRESENNDSLNETKRRYRDKIAKRFSESIENCDETTFIQKMVVEIDLSNTTFDEIGNAISQSGCIIIDIRNQDSRAFFWLGYLHAIGAHVIPVNASEVLIDNDKKVQNTMAFDVAGLWYAQFNPSEPLIFQTTLSDIIGFIYDEKAKQLQKDAFWRKILSDRPISVFLGTVSEEKLGRNSLGDWDYRSAAEITSFLSQKSHKVVLENPIIKPSNPDAARMGQKGVQYLERLKGHLSRKNCIIIGSSDINELTEVVWATIHGLNPFESIKNDETTTKYNENIDCYIALKEYVELTEEDKKRLFGYGKQGMASFILQDAQSASKEKRGFIYREGSEQGTQILQEFIPHQSDAKRKAVLRTLYGQLIVCRNPWSPDNWIIIINGTSGPATLGITQILTGCQYEDFTMSADSVSNKDKDKMLSLWFNSEMDGNITKKEFPSYNELSENLLTKCLTFLENDTLGFEGIIEVGVYYPSEELLNDERKVVGWRFMDIRKQSGGATIPNPRYREWFVSKNV